MFKLAWRGVRHNRSRYIATLVAIMTGVAFFVSTGFVADRVIRALEGDVNRQFGAVDVAVVVNDDPAAGEAFANGLKIGGDAADRIFAAPGVATGAGELTGNVSFLGDDGKPFADGATGRLWIEDEKLNPLEVAEGRGPAADGEIAVDRGLADDHGFTVGQSVQLLTLSGQHPARIVGITKFARADSIDRQTVSLPAATAFAWLNSGHVEYDELWLRGSVSQAELRTTVQPLVPPGFVSKTGSEFRSDKRAEVGGFGQVLKKGMQFFAILALFVGGFVIYNTFSVVVAQRSRELAVLAAVGATPKQLKRSLRFEGLVVGVVGSALGVLAGLLLAFVLIAVLGAGGIELPGSGIVVGSGTVVQGIVAGTLITLLSVMSPARRAGRVEPVEAMRQAATDHASLSHRRAVAAALSCGLGAGAMLFGPAAMVGLGALALFVGAVVAGPFLAVAAASIGRRLVGRSLEGRLASDNTARNPRRTATTANALLTGVFLVTLVTVAGTSLKDFVVQEINKLSSADYTMESTGGTIDDQLVTDLRGIHGVADVVPFRREEVTLDGSPAELSTGDIAELVKVAGLTTSSGSLDDLGPGKVAVIEEYGKDRALGSTVELRDSRGRISQLEVAAVMKSSIDTISVGNLVDAATFDGFVGDTAPTVAFVQLVTGAQSDTKDAIEARTKLRPDITLVEGNLLGQLFGRVFDFLISAVNGLLLMSVVVALIGIINTLSLSILERRRELGLLRVVGMLDRRVRRMVRVESVLVAALGTLGGLALGTFMGFALVHGINRLSSADISFSLPFVFLGVVLGLGVLLGFVASLIPARRSTHLDVLEAIQAT